MNLNEIQNYQNEAKNFALKAINFNKLKKFEEAFENYLNAIEKLNLLCEIDNNKHSKVVYNKKLKEYCKTMLLLNDSNKKIPDKIDVMQTLNEIKETASVAIEYDKNKNYNNAKFYYLKAIDKIKLLLLFDETSYNRELYIKKAKEYYNRVKSLNFENIENRDLDNFRNDVKNLVSKAEKLNQLEKYEEAKEYYIKAIEKLKLLLKYDDNLYNRETYLKKAKEYYNRVKSSKNKNIDDIEIIDLNNIRNDIKKFAAKAIKLDKLEKYEEANYF